MKIYVISFTEKGYKLGRTLKDSMPSYDMQLIYKGHAENDGGIEVSELSLPEICRKAFEGGVPLIFIGAAGIAVRSIAHFVKDKLTDPPVVVIDELGRYAIPILSGHMGGANELTAEISAATGAAAVITTATDINDAFSVDLFAKENGLGIVNREGIARVSASALEGRPVTISIKNYPPKEAVDVLISDEAMPGMASITLCPKKIAVGIGCRRGKTMEEISSIAETLLTEYGIGLSEVGCIATIDIKKDEEGLRQLSQAWRVPLITFDATVLAAVPGDFSSSQTVLEQVGVDNVCERAAVLAAGQCSKLIVKKTALKGITVAAAEKR